MVFSVNSGRKIVLNVDIKMHFSLKEYLTIERLGKKNLWVGWEEEEKQAQLDGEGKKDGGN